jgi:MFS family permease
MRTSVTTRGATAIVLALSLSAFLISVDVTIVNVALPTLVRSLGASATQLQWVVDAYSLTFAALVLAAGSLSDRQGRKGTLFLPARPGGGPETDPPSGGGALAPGADPLEPALQSAAYPTPERPVNATTLRSAITQAEHEPTEDERSDQ